MTVEVPIPSAEQPVYIDLDDHERETGALSGSNLYAAITAFHRDGIVVLRNAIDPEILTSLNVKMMQDTQKLQSGQGLTHFAGRYVGGVAPANGGNISQMPPLTKDFMFPEVYANLPATTVLKHLFGPRPELRFIRTNTLHRTEHRQIVHKDARRDHLLHPYAIAMNICLVDCDETNGSTELWLGTARDTVAKDNVNAIRGEIKQDVVEARRKVRPPVRPKLPLGSVVLRDTRLWHAGMPNPTDTVRVMLAMVWFPSWFSNENTMQFPESLRTTVGQLERRADIVIGASVPYEGFFWSKWNPPADETNREAIEESKRAQNGK